MDQNLFEAMCSKDGAVCPCCDRWGKVHKRKLNSSIARGLIEVYLVAQLTGDEWVKIKELKLPDTMYRQIPTARYWLLVERAEGKLPDGNPKTGLYRLTELGKEFVLHKKKLAKHVYVYDDEVKAFSDEFTDVVDALGDKFSYRELMDAS